MKTSFLCFFKNINTLHSILPIEPCCAEQHRRMVILSYSKSICTFLIQKPILHMNCLLCFCFASILKGSISTCFVSSELSSDTLLSMGKRSLVQISIHEVSLKMCLPLHDNKCASVLCVCNCMIHLSFIYKMLQHHVQGRFHVSFFAKHLMTCTCSCTRTEN